MAENKKYKVIISDSSKEMLKTHINHIAQLNKSAAVAKKKAIMTALRSLAWMLQRFPFFEEIHIPPNKYRKMVISNYYIVLYQIQQDTVYVDYIFHCRNDFSRILRL